MSSAQVMHSASPFPIAPPQDSTQIGNDGNVGDDESATSQPFELQNFTLKGFVLPEKQRYRTPFDKFADDAVFPVIDLARANGHGAEARRDTIAELARAAAAWGFFNVVNHGVPLAVIQRNQAHARRVFAKPVEEKLRIERPPGTFFEYLTGSSFGKSHASWNESVNFHWSPDRVNLTTAQVWPENPDRAAELSADVLEYLEHMDTLSRQLLELLTEGLGLPPTRISQYYSRQSPSYYKLNHYPPCRRPDLAQGLWPHTDPQTLTILYQDFGGLQLQKDGEWLGVRPDTGSLVVNIGDTLQAWSNGKYRSVKHRAALNPTTSRISLAFFLNPGEEVTIAPLPELIDETNPAKYRPFSWVEYRALAFHGSGHRLDHVAIDHVAI